jgi:two-component system, OmpR family, response regulator
MKASAIAMGPPSVIKKVLLIDDDADVRRIGSMSLRRLGGFEVLLASSGAEGLITAEQSQPHLILLDLIMPGLDGFVTIAELKKSSLAKAIPVIMLTSAKDALDLEKAKEIGALGVIYKPLDPLKLPSQARELVEQSRGR